MSLQTMSVVAEKRVSKDVPWAFTVTIFLSAALLFQIQLLIAKQILPWFGGAAAVWNTCMFVFQALLLSGYVYSHIVANRFSPRLQSRIHRFVVIASVVTLALQTALCHRPLLPAQSLRSIGAAHPILGILAILTTSVGLPFFVLSTTGPLVQSWFARVSPESSPYRLFATSNAGSLFGLAAYPFLVEWMFRLKTQAWLWSIGYVAFSGGVLVLARNVSRLSPSPLVGRVVSEDSEPVGRWRFLLWVGLSACPSSMMLAATSQISTNVPPIPFLWMLPLVLYLLSLMICFDNEKWFQRVVFYPLHFLTVTGIVLFNAFTGDPEFGPVLGLYCLVVFTTGMVAHGELARSKPGTKHLTSFYLAVATGGVLGGALVGLVAPVVFRDIYEFRITIILTFVLLAIALFRDSQSWLRRGSPAAATALFLATSLAALLPAMQKVFPWPASHHLLYISTVSLLSVGVFLVSWRTMRQATEMKRVPLFLCFLYLFFLVVVAAGST
ncbi:MAG: hypothetical protein WAR24_03740, partial [Candidatus Acidiferrales bacterium]